MLIVPIQEARVGMKLAMSVLSPSASDQELLKAGYVLDEAVLEKLRAMDVVQIMVDFPGLDDLDQIIMPMLSPERQAIYKQVKTLIAGNERASQPVVRYSSYVDTTRGFIEAIMGRAENAPLLDVLNQSGDEIEHATTVAHLALVLGLRLDAYLIRERSRLDPRAAKDVTHLGVAAMLHDVGKSKLPEELRKYHTMNPPPDEASLAEWKRHAALGYDMIRGEVNATASAAVYQHHQRYDGEGFPAVDRAEGRAPLRGEQIHPFARILAAANLFDRLSRASDGKRRPNYQVLHLLRTQYSSWIDPAVLAAMPQVIPPFSPGRKITLSDNTQGIVIGFSVHAPYQPALKRFQPDGLSVSDEVIDLRKQENLRVTAIDGTPLQQLEKPLQKP